jgi:pimeloyl-ACP methyl ester carboxylesterase
MKRFDEVARRAPARSTVICLHASGGSGAQWKTVAERLQDDFHVLTPDLHGHGAGPAWAGAPTAIVATDAARIARMAANASGDVHLVGHAYGGALALRVALYHPESVASVAVYEPLALRALFDYDRHHRAAVEIADVASAIRAALAAGDPVRAARCFVDYESGGGRWDELAPDAQAAIAERMPVVLAHFTALSNDVVRLWDYRSVRQPVLYLTGSETRIATRRAAELLQYTLPDVDPVTMAGMGHPGPITHADAVAQRIAEFVRARDAVRPPRDLLAA